MGGLDSPDIMVSHTSDQLDRMTDSTVSRKYMGTAIDQQDMHTLGRIQELRRNFKFVAVLAFGCTLIGTWGTLPAIIQFGLLDGGTAGLIYCFIGAICVYLCVYLSIAEMASMAPTAGGQYHWVSEFAPKSCQRYLSYLSGWLVSASWQFAIVGASFGAGTVIQGLIVLNYTHYKFERWEGTLLVYAVLVFSIIFNVFLAKKLAFVECILLVIYVLGFFAIVLPLWVLGPRSSSHAVFTEFNNGGAWPTTGIAVMIGMAATSGTLSGFDCAVHMAEEIYDASVTLPRAIVSGVLTNGVMGLIMLITLCYNLGDLQSVLDTPTKYPFIQIFFNATESYIATNVMVSIVVIVEISTVISTIATSSRQLWSFARDGGLPFSSFIAKVNKGKSVPLNAISVSFVVTVLTSLINIGSTEALNAIGSLVVSTVILSYILTISCLISKRLRGPREPLPYARWSLGRYGMAVNLAAVAGLSPLFVFSFFPLTTPTTVVYMNWSSVVFAGVIVLSTVYYFIGGGRQRYTPPVFLVRRPEYEHDVKT